MDFAKFGLAPKYRMEILPILESDSTPEPSPEGTSPLCPQCKRLDIRWMNQQRVSSAPITVNTSWQIIKESYEALKASASCCALCYLLLQELNAQGHDDSNTSKLGEVGIELRVNESAFSVSRSAGVSEMYVGWPYQGIRVALALLANADSPAALSKDVAGRCIKPATDLKWAKNCFKNCVSNHDHGSHLAGTRPMRLVAVGTEDSAQLVHLIDGSAVQGDYATLSHCWGKHAWIRTTMATLSAYKTCIPWYELSKTFQDAIVVARGLGIAYLWIDSLCIIQDDPLDWEKESANMANIYINAVLNIAAASASDGRGGCFRPRQPNNEGITLHYTDADGSSSACIFITKMPPGYSATVANGPLLKRAWVCQERLLSKRKIIFGEDQLYWQCGPSTYSESCIEDSAFRDKAEFQVFSNPSFRYEKISYRVNNDYFDRPRDWRSLIEVYSAGALTKSDDRLPALSGLAKAFARRTGHKYAAGLWEEELHDTLLWYLTRPNSSRRELPYRAPSWSWASIDGACRFIQPTRTIMTLDDIQSDIQLAGLDPFGKVTSGTLHVTGRVKIARVEFSPQTINRPDDPLNFPLFDRDIEIGDATLDDIEETPEEVLCLQVSYYDKYTSVLLLRYAESEGQYLRIGIGWLHIETEWFADVAKTRIVII